VAHSTSKEVIGRIWTIEEREEGLLVSIDMYPDSAVDYVVSYYETVDAEREEIVNSTPHTD
jgi:hypothetical protein